MSIEIATVTVRDTLHDKVTGRVMADVKVGFFLNDENDRYPGIINQHVCMDVCPSVKPNRLKRMIGRQAQRIVSEYFAGNGDKKTNIFNVDGFFQASGLSRTDEQDLERELREIEAGLCMP